MLMVREELLHQRANLTIDKLQLEERKQMLSKALANQRKERKELENKEQNVKEAIHKLKSFIATFQKSPPQYPIPAKTSSSSAEPYTATHSKSSSPSHSAICSDTDPPSTSSIKLYHAASNTLLHSKQQKLYYRASNAYSISSVSFPTPTKVVSSPSSLHCSTFSSFPACTKASSNKTATSVSPLLTHPLSRSSHHQAYLPTLSQPRPASPSIGLASYPHGSKSPGSRSFSQRISSPDPPSYPHVNPSPDPAPHTCHSPPLKPASSFKHGSPEPVYLYSRVSSSIGQESNSLRLPSPVPLSLDLCNTSPQDLKIHPVDSPPLSHVHPGSNPPAILESSKEGLDCPYTNSQSIKFPCKRKFCISDSVFHDHKNGLATHKRTEGNVVTAPS